MLVPIFALALTQQPYMVPETNRGSLLYKECRASVRVGDGTANSGDSVISNFCIGYIDGFTDGLLMAGFKVICVNGATLGTVARVYVAYMEAHPKEMDMERSVGLVGALLESYPCPVPKK